MKFNFKKTAYTLAEAVAVMVVLSFIITAMINLTRHNITSESVIKKAGTNGLLQISFATKQILAKYSTSYTMINLKNISGTAFAITASNAAENLSPLYKKILINSSNTVPSTYTDSYLVNESGAKINSNMKVSGFTQGFVAKNGTYIAFKLNGNCTTSISYIYDPSVPENRNAANTCGLIFFDVNADAKPNILGVDQYIIAFGKDGIK